MSAPSGPDGARVRCLYCGANNFPASPSCWQCHRPLQTLPTDAAPTPGTARTPAPSSPPPPSTAGGASVRSAGLSNGNPALANKSAAALGLLFPPVALPVGMVFLMLDDPRKTQLGWITIGWSVVGTVLNVILFFLTLAPALAVLKPLIPGGGHGGGLPALPPMPGGDTENIITLLHYSKFLRAPG